jgi:hypothetical protein
VTDIPVPRSLDRRQVLKGAAAAGLAALVDPLPRVSAMVAAQRDVIRAENARAGSTDWQLTRVRLDDRQRGFRSPWIEGYCSKQSVKAGDSIDIVVSTDPPVPFHIEFFRMGYYGGLGARKMTTLGPFPGKAQPVPEVGPKNIRECRWEPTTTLTIPDDWPSGVYLGRMTLEPPDETTGAWQSYVIFIVRDERPAEILFQCSDNTWQAYNRWPSRFSLYLHPKAPHGPWADVSFDRPYGREAQFDRIVDDPLTIGSGEFLPFEFPLAYFLEQHGYDVTYCCNADMISPEHWLKCKAFISVGHDEYWDIRQYESAVAMRDAGVNLLFLSGNSVCWVTPFKPSYDGRPNRIIFRGGPFGGKYKHAEKRERLEGPYPDRGPDEGYLLGARNIDPVTGGADWICTKPEHWIFEGTGMKKGDRIPGLVGWESHDEPPTDLPGLEIVGQGTTITQGKILGHWVATIYPGPKGNFVFNASTIFWAQGLSAPPGHMLPWSHWTRPHGPDPRVQRITQNLLHRAIGGSPQREPKSAPTSR